MIRKAARADLDAIRRCAESAYSPYVERIGKKPAPMVADFASLIADGRVYLALDANEGPVRGYVVFYPRADHVHLENVAVEPASQGRGIGRSLIEFAESETLRLGFDRIELYTNARMYENLELYPRLGYRQTGRRVEDGFDRVYFSKTLT